MVIQKIVYALRTVPGFALLPVALLVACGGEQTAGSGGGEVHTYTVRGEVRSVPQPDNPASAFQLRHESIPDFVDMDGEVVGMESMTMPFPVKPERLPEGLAVGDPVEMTFRLDWQGTPAIAVTEVRKLPPDTVLDFSP